MNPVLILVLIFSQLMPAANSVPSSCSDLMPDGYDTMEPPSNRTQAYLDQNVFNIGDISTRDQTFVLKLRVIIEWIDPRVINSSKLSKYVGMRVASKFNDCFWKPLLTIINLAGEAEVQKSQHLFNSDKEGLMIYSRHFKLLVNCPMDFTWYPMDVQNCWTGFVAYKFDGTYMSWSKARRFNDTIRHESAYDVTIRRVDGCIYNPKIQSSCQQLKLRFNRRLGMYLMTVYFPSSLIVIVSFISFWIDPLSVPGRVTLTVTSLLALMTQFISVRAPLADVNHCTAIDVWFMGCILIVAFTMFEFATNHFIAFNASKKAISVMNFVNYKNNEERDFKHAAKNVLKKLKLTLINTDYDSMSRIIFPIIFLSYSSVYWITLLTYSSD